MNKNKELNEIEIMSRPLYIGEKYFQNPTPKTWGKYVETQYAPRLFPDICYSENGHCDKMWFPFFNLVSLIFCLVFSV